MKPALARRSALVRRGVGCVVLAILAAMTGCRAPVRETASASGGTALDGIRVQTLEGGRVPAPVPPGTKAVVFVFLGVECPIANRALPELADLESRTRAKGVRFIHVYPNADETPDRIRRHRADFGLAGEAYRDPELRVARLLGARWTPEAVALTPSGALIYQGRINDQYAALGVSRPEPTRHDLADALNEYLQGAAPRGRVVPGVGCTFR